MQAIPPSCFRPQLWPCFSTTPSLQTMQPGWGMWTSSSGCWEQGVGAQGHWLGVELVRVECAPFCEQPFAKKEEEKKGRLLCSCMLTVPAHTRTPMPLLPLISLSLSLQGSSRPDPTGPSVPSHPLPLPAAPPPSPPRRRWRLLSAPAALPVWGREGGGGAGALPHACGTSAAGGHALGHGGVRWVCAWGGMVVVVGG